MGIGDPGGTGARRLHAGGGGPGAGRGAGGPTRRGGPTRQLEGLLLPATPVVRVNTASDGSAACPHTLPTTVDVVDDLAAGRTTVTVDTSPPSSSGPIVQKVSASALQRIEVHLCGSSNSFRYQLAASNRTLTRPRQLNITGADGPDYVTVDLYANRSGHHVTVEQPVGIALRTGSGSDQVEIRLNKLAGPAVAATADLGSGNDSFTLVTRPQPMQGSLDLRVEGKQGNDGIFLDLYDTVPFVVPQGSSITMHVSGDTLDTFAQVSDNLANHGSDRLVAGFRGQVLGSLDIRLVGDDNLFRLKDLACSRPVCAFRCECASGPCPPPTAFDWPTCDAPRGLEAAIRNDPAYAGDTVKLRLDLTSGSSGSVTASLDGGLGGDEVVFDPTDISAGGHFLTLSGGQPHHFKSPDRCYPGPGQSVVSVQDCDETLPGPGDFN